MRKGQRRPERRSQPLGWGNCWTFATGRWLRDPRHTYIIGRLTHSNKAPVLHTMFAESIDGVRVMEVKPLRNVKWMPWWALMLYAIWFPYRIREGFGEERTRCRYPNPRIKRRKRAH